MFKKRRFFEQDTDELDRSLVAQIAQAAETQQRCAQHEAADAYPGLPEHLSAVNDLDAIAAMGSEPLRELKTQVHAAHDAALRELADFEALGKQLRVALDATLALVALKAELPHKRRKVEPEAAEAVAAPPVLSPSPPPAAPSPQPRSDSVASVHADELTVGRQIAFKLPQSAVDEWIQCEITRIVTPGYRFEVRDPEPDEKGNPGKSYQCRVKDIMLLPLRDQPVRPIPVGTIVLARYPETTAFYKATVCSYNAKKRVYNLKFEGEEDLNKETEVEDTLVLRLKR